MLLDADDCQLVLMDYQTRLMPVMFESELVLTNAVRLARMSHIMQVPVWCTVQTPGKLGPSVPALQAALDAAGGKTLDKAHFSAVAEGLGDWLRPPARKLQPAAPALPVRGNARSLPKHLQRPPQQQAQEDEPGPNTIVIAGCEAHVCLLQTALDLLEEEFEVWVVTDACSSRSERNRDAAFDRLAGNGAELVTTEMVAFEWLRTAQHPAFRDLLACVK